MIAARRLELLHAVSTAGSITAAARELDYSPSAVSQQIAALEREARTRLIVRLPRGIKLTDAGHALARHGEAIARHVRDANEDLEELHSLGAGRVRIAAFPSAGAAIVPRLVAEFARDHPRIEVSLELLEPRASVEALRDGAIDLALAFTYSFGPAEDLGDLRLEASFDDPIHLAVARDHPLAHASAVRPARLASAPWIANTDPVCALMLRHVATEGRFDPAVNFESDDYLTVGRLVAGGLGIALVPGLAADALPESVSLRPLRPALSRRIVLLSGPDPSPATDAMLEVARPIVAAS